MVKGNPIHPSRPSNKVFKIENTMITYYNHTHMTAVPTRLLLDTNLSAEAKLTGALLYTFEDGGLSAQELAEVSSPRRSPAGHQQRREGTLRAAA